MQAKFLQPRIRHNLTDIGEGGETLGRAEIHRQLRPEARCCETATAKVTENALPLSVYKPFPFIALI